MNKAEYIKRKAKKKFSWRILWENFVFKEWKHYYKMPSSLAKNVIYRKTDSYEKVQESFEIIKKYFWPLTIIPKTKIFCDVQNHYVIRQKEIEGEKLTRKHLEDNPKLVSKFRRLIIANEVMWLNEWVFLDLIGSDIITHPNTIHNLLTDGENIYVFDFGLLEKHSKSIFFRYFSHFGQWFQLLFIKKFF